MNFNEYQQKCLTTDHYPSAANNYIDIRWSGEDTDKGLCILLHGMGLVGEAGEVADKLKKVYRDHSGIFTPEIILALVKELGDNLWYIATLADDLGWELEDVAKLNIDKLAIRAQNKTIQGSGDNR